MVVISRILTNLRYDSLTRNPSALTASPSATSRLQPAGESSIPVSNPPAATMVNHPSPSPITTYCRFTIIHIRSILSLHAIKRRHHRLRHCLLALSLLLVQLFLRLIIHRNKDFDIKFHVQEQKKLFLIPVVCFFGWNISLLLITMESVFQRTPEYIIEVM